MKVLVLGANGMVGHVVTLYLVEKGHEVIGASRETCSFCNSISLDVLDEKKVKAALEIKYDYVINCVGVLNKAVEENAYEGIFVNSVFPHYLEKKLKETDTKIIHISTDCVFKGDKGGYDENATVDANSMYGMSKALGEISTDKNLTFRTSVVGPEIRENGIGLFNWFMEQQKKVNGFTNVIWTGVTTLELAKAINRAMEQEVSGLYHLVNNEKISKYNLLILFNRYFKNSKIEVIRDDTFYSDKSLINTRNDFRYTVPSYDIMLQELYDWMLKYQKLYYKYRL